MVRVANAELGRAGEVAAFGKRYPANARPVQPLNRRRVLASQ